MITLTLAVPATPNAAANTNALSADGTEAAQDFALLLEPEALTPESPVAIAPIGPETQDEAPVDPASILDAIASAQAPATAPVATPAIAQAAVPAARSASPRADALTGGDGRTRAADGPLTGARPGPLPALASVPAAPASGAVETPHADFATRALPEAPAPTHLVHAHAPNAPRPVAEPPVQLQLPQQIATPAWDEGLADHAIWMARNDVQTAELHLNPAELGPIEVTLTLTGEDKTQAVVQFSAAHAGTREAIETALPRLREMLQENGITLGQAGVDGNTRQAATENGDQGPAQGQGQGRATQDAADAGNGTSLPSHEPVRLGRNGLVDTFA